MIVLTGHGAKRITQVIKLVKNVGFTIKQEVKTLKYKVPFSGFVYVEAESSTEALEMAQDDCTIYEEKEFSAPKEIDKFYIRL